MIPVFDGKEAYWWLINVEQHFGAAGTPESQKLLEAVRALQGRALNWYQWWEWRNPNATWWTFLKALVKRFQPEYDLDQPVWVRDEEPEPEIETEIDPVLEKLEAENAEEEIKTENEGADVVVVYRFQATVDGGEEEMCGKLTVVMEEEINGEGQGKGGGANLLGVNQTTPTTDHMSKLEMVSDPMCCTGAELPELSRSRSKEKLSSDHLLRPTNVRREGVDKEGSPETGGGCSRSVDGRYEGGGLGGKKGVGLGNDLDGHCVGGGWGESEERHQADGSSIATEFANSCTPAKLLLPELLDLDPRLTAEGQLQLRCKQTWLLHHGLTPKASCGLEMDVRTELELPKLGSLSNLMGQAQHIEGSNWASRNDKIGSHFGQKHRLHSELDSRPFSDVIELQVEQQNRFPLRWESGSRPEMTQPIMMSLGVKGKPLSISSSTRLKMALRSVKCLLNLYTKADPSIFHQDVKVIQSTESRDKRGPYSKELNSRESVEPNPAGFHEQVSIVFTEGYKIFESRFPGANETASNHFILQLHHNGLLKGNGSGVLLGVQDIEIELVQDFILFDPGGAGANLRMDGVEGLGEVRVIFINISNEGFSVVPGGYNMVTPDPVSEEVFFCWLNGNPKAEHGGERVIGGVHPKNFKGEHAYVPIRKIGYWQFEMRDFLMCCLSTGVCEGGCTAIMDSGTTLITAPTPLVAEVNYAIGVEVKPEISFLNGQIRGTMFQDNADGFLQIPVVCIHPISDELLKTVAACCKQCGVEISSTKVGSME